MAHHAPGRDGGPPPLPPPPRYRAWGSFGHFPPPFEAVPFGSGLGLSVTGCGVPLQRSMDSAIRAGQTVRWAFEHGPIVLVGTVPKDGPGTAVALLLGALVGGM